MVSYYEYITKNERCQDLSTKSIVVNMILTFGRALGSDSYLYFNASLNVVRYSTLSFLGIYDLQADIYKTVVVFTQAKKM